MFISISAILMVLMGVNTKRMITMRLLHIIAREICVNKIDED